MNGKRTERLYYVEGQAEFLPRQILRTADNVRLIKNNDRFDMILTMIV